jgi:hypothetical protein
MSWGVTSKEVRKERNSGSRFSATFDTGFPVTFVVHRMMAGMAQNLIGPLGWPFTRAAAGQNTGAATAASRRRKLSW